MNHVKQQEEKNRVNVLAVLRVLAAMLVFILHARPYVEGIDLVTHPLMFLTFMPAWGGVWIFILISGYLMGQGFDSGRYQICVDNCVKGKKILDFYYKRFLRIAPLYYLFCIFFELFSGRVIAENPWNLLRILTFTYNGADGTPGISHLWYVSLIMQLYLMAPFIYLLIRKITSFKVNVGVYVIMLIIGLVTRIILAECEADWHRWIYSFVFCNLDIFVCGMLLAKSKVLAGIDQKKGSIKKFCRGVSVILMIVLILYNCYNYAEGSKVFDWYVYQNILPTFYILLSSLLIFLFSTEPKRVNKNYWISRIIDWFASYTFAFYILHAGVLEYVKRMIGDAAWYYGRSMKIQYVLFIGISFVITTLLAVIVTKWTTNMRWHKK